MASTKKKIQEEISKNKSQKREVVQETISEDSRQAMQLWQKELEDLESMSFNSLEEAIDVLIEKVLLRLEAEAASREETKNFLTELFATDPTLQEELKAILKIKD